MKKKHFASLTVGLSVLLSLLSLAGLCPTGFAQDSEQLPVGYRASETASPNGDIAIEVKDGENWVYAVKIPFDQYLRAGRANLAALLPDPKAPVSIRLTKHGGGSAHLDAAQLGGLSPSATTSPNSLALKKLSQQDDDVLELPENGLEVTFPAGRSDSIIAISGRIETATISKTPFQFPLENTYREMTVDSAFYAYNMGSVKGRLTVDGDISEVDQSAPFIKEYVTPGSGHPPGYTYAWVMNDEQNLYVAIDFTPDNTMDGDKDYTKVYVKTPAGLKAYKVSVPEATWGRPGFVYTDKVAYQHKVYEFAIPFSEIGVDPEQREIQLAFAAYGTATPGDRMPAIAYDPQANRYLSLYTNIGYSGQKLVGNLIDAQGALVNGAGFPISEAIGFPDPNDESVSVVRGVYGVDTPSFLAAWPSYINDENGFKNVIASQFIRASDGSPLGNTTVVTDVYAIPTDQHAAVAYDPINHRYLVVWEDDRDQPAGYRSYDIYGQLLNGDGTLRGGNFVICNNGDQDDVYMTANQYDPVVAFDSQNEKYLVVWQDFRSFHHNDIYGQFVNADGALAGPASAINMPISTSAEEKYDPALAYDDMNHRFLVVWQQGDYGSQDIYGKLISVSSSSPPASLPDLPISTAPNNQSNPAVAFNSTDQKFLVVWSDERNTSTNQDIYGQLVNADGSLDPAGGSSAANRVIQATTEREVGASVAYNPHDNNFLVAYTDSGTSLYSLEYTQFPPPPSDLQVVSLSSDGMQGDDSCQNPCASADGRYVAFSSSADNLVSGDTNNSRDVFLRDRQTGETIRVSVSSEGVQGDGDSDYPSISADGNRVVYRSYATNLVSGDSNNKSDIFLYDKLSGHTTRVSVSTTGAQADGDSDDPVISADGKRVAFDSPATNLVAGDTNGVCDVYVRDLVNGETGRVSVASGGAQSDGNSSCPSINADGRFVTYSSDATNLVAGDNNAAGDVFLHDRQTGATTLVSVASDGSQGNRGSRSGSRINADGRFVAFDSEATNLVSGDTNEQGDVFVRDVLNGVTTRVNVASNGAQGDTYSFVRSISPDGRYVTFDSGATTLVTGNTNGYLNSFVHDRQTGETTCISKTPSGGLGDGSSADPVIVANGNVVFSSGATNLAPGDSNSWDDILMYTGPLFSARNDDSAPVWSGGELTVTDINETSVKITWPAASDNVGVTNYRLYKNGLVENTVANTGEATITNLLPGSVYTFAVQAGDAAGNWSVAGPQKQAQKGFGLRAGTLDSYAYAIGPGDAHQTGLTAKYNDGSSLDKSQVATYSSSNPAVASVDASGRVIAHEQGTALIRAEYGGKSVAAFVAVGPARAYRFTVNPSSVSVTGGHIHVPVYVTGASAESAPAKALFTLLADGVPVSTTQQDIAGNGMANVSFDQVAYQQDKAYLVRVLIWDSGETMHPQAWPLTIPVP
ncbi:hypothetical protein GTO89_14255 [Heliobacterium gestii]|uniref:Fibronectin type-III domain-containing protein n=1 Tax=Heliomicrobium gestii TaxID=2699 RepID=A0A845LBM3_HELGE|nr:fibronectin type III domain-containing protein [Heliomicrobium gestii]MBM7867804.1 hypothetical protein [Heliomicrobium gestii]MZP44197.1 hypothetical protein [Heliomicrobium gestii]